MLLLKCQAIVVLLTGCRVLAPLLLAMWEIGSLHWLLDLRNVFDFDAVNLRVVGVTFFPTDLDE